MYIVYNIENLYVYVCKVPIHTHTGYKSTYMHILIGRFTDEGGAAINSLCSVNDVYGWILQLHLHLSTVSCGDFMIYAGSTRWQGGPGPM